MGVQKRRSSKMRKRLRRGQDGLTAPGLVACPQCHELMRAHRVCPNCGYYKAKEVFKKAE